MGLMLALLLVVVPTPPDQTDRLQARAVPPPVVMSRSELDALYARAVAFIAPDVRVFCHDAASWAEATKNSRDEIKNAPAFARIELREIHLNDFMCATVDAFTTGSETVRTPSAYRAVQALAHEAWHVAGVSDEAEADCKGDRAVVQVAIALGATSERAAEIARYVRPGCG